MSDELRIVPPVVTHLNNPEQVLIQMDTVQQAGSQVPTPTEEQIRSADRVFSRQKKTDDGLATILGVTTGFLVLHDMAVDRFSIPEEEEDPAQPKEKPEES